MAVRIADTLKQQNNLKTFPVAYGEDIWLDENKGSGTADYDSLQNLYNDGKLGGSSIQVTIMPNASETYLDTVLLYIGETGTYKYGTYYKCISDGETPPTYSWVDAEIGGGTKIFYGTMDEWDALSTDAKKQYDYMADNDEGDDKSATGVITRNTSNTSGMQEAYLKRIGKTVLLHCNLTDCVLPANEITTYATVQDGFRPDSSLQWAMLDLDFTIEGLRGWITNSGNIQLLSPVATTSSIRIQSMYFTD